MNYLFCSVGRRGELLKNFRESLEAGEKTIAADNSQYAPALYFADTQYVVPRIDSPDYIETLLEICEKEQVNAITTLIDPEISVLAHNRPKFSKAGVSVLAPDEATARLCFDKYAMFKFLQEHNISTPMTWQSIEMFNLDHADDPSCFPVFVKPRTGSGSVGAQKIASYAELERVIQSEPDLIIQELMDGMDLTADVYVDLISKRAVSCFTKKKIETRIGGASKTISFKDPALFEFISQIVSVLSLGGPADMDFFYRDGTYYLSEINPRFGGAYLHAYGTGVDFIKLIKNNLNGIENKQCFGQYEEDIVMMMYDSVIIKRQKDLCDVTQC